jgi:hypothetical protein
MRKARTKGLITEQLKRNSRNDLARNSYTLNAIEGSVVSPDRRAWIVTRRLENPSNFNECWKCLTVRPEEGGIDITFQAAVKGS